jgi:hypothetical protein
VIPGVYLINTPNGPRYAMTNGLKVSDFRINPDYIFMSIYHGQKICYHSLGLLDRRGSSASLIALMELL